MEKKRLLLILENHFCIDKNDVVWCERVVNYEYIKRYLTVFDEVVLMGRCKVLKENDSNDLLKVSGSNVTFVSLPEFKGIKGLVKNILTIRKKIKEELKNIDCVIYRVPTHIAIFSYDLVVKNKKTLGLEMMMAANKMIEGNGVINRFLNNWIDLKVKKMCKKANGVSYVTEKMLQMRYPCKALIDNNKDYFTENYSSIELNENDFKKQDWNKNKKPDVFKIVHTGYMDSYRKGQDTLIKAISKVDKKYNVEVIFIGDGKKRKEFEELAEKLGIKNKVSFLGYINNKKKILNIIHNAHLFVFPTHSEGLPRTVIEAMSQGLPCISSPVDGIPELLEDRFLIEYHNVDGYSKKIEELLDDWEEMIEIGEKNFLISKRYSKELLQKKRTTFYRCLYNIS